MCEISPFYSILGYRSVLLDSVERQSTLSSDNPLTTSVDATVVDTLTDHILIQKRSGLHVIYAKV